MFALNISSSSVNSVSSYPLLYTGLFKALSTILSPIIISVHSLKSVSCLFAFRSVVVEMFCHGLPPGRWGGKLKVLTQLTVGGGKLQSYFVLITEWRPWTLNVFLLGQIFSTAGRCVRDFIGPMEKWVIHLEKSIEQWLLVKCSKGSKWQYNPADV